jgi:hypothetical protein
VAAVETFRTCVTTFNRTIAVSVALIFATSAHAATVRLICHRSGDLSVVTGFHRFDIEVSSSGEVTSIKSETWPGELRIWRIPTKRETKPFGDYYPPMEMEISFEHYPPNRPKDAAFNIHRFTLAFRAWQFDEAGKSSLIIGQGQCWMVGQQKF